MKKTLILLAFAVLISAASATTISQENAVINLEDNTVDAEVHVEELTSSSFTYISSNSIENVNATLDGEDLECSISEPAIGSEIRCDTDLRENFTVNLNYRIGDDIVNERNGVNVFQYSHPIYRPTDNYHLEIVLPEGMALIEQGNRSQQVISPLNYDTGSNGRQIYVAWDLKPNLGETLSFYVLYEDFQDADTGFQLDYSLLARALGVSLLLIAAVSILIKWKRKDLSEEYGDLSEDQKKVIEKIEENGGEYLQKDLVQEMDYSKAKISGLVSELVDKGILNKSKEGRSNKLSISRKYRY